MTKLTKEQLEKANKLHRKELKQIDLMTDQQFQIFKRNISVGCLEGITKSEAKALLMSMLTVNLNLQAQGEYI